MARGTLRIFLGAAPGVGKTFEMLQFGNRELHRGRDVVAISSSTPLRRSRMPRQAPAARASGQVSCRMSRWVIASSIQDWYGGLLANSTNTPIPAISRVAHGAIERRSSMRRIRALIMTPFPGGGAGSIRRRSSATARSGRSRRSRAWSGYRSTRRVD